MSSERRTAAVAIGVSDAAPLPFLGGAVNGAIAFHEWAQALGYDSRLVTDESEPVTAVRLRLELEALLTADGAGTHRLLIYFAGHGVIREVEEGLWLLSDWNQELRGIAVEALKRRLYLFRVEQVAIFADACRSLPADINTADLIPEALLGRGPGPQSTRMAVDKFIAAQDGTRTFMIPGAEPNQDRCLFSGVLLQALWGTQQNAFSKLLPGKVTSRSLAAFLQTEVPVLAQSYDVELVPSVSPTFPEDDDVYFGEGPQVTPPDFPPWPPAADLLAHLPTSTLRGPQTTRSPNPQKSDHQKSDHQIEERLRAQDRPDAFESRSGFAVEGQAVLRIWTAPGVVAEQHVRPDWWRIRPGNKIVLDHPAPVLIEFANGLIAATTSLPEFIGSVVVTDRGVSALVYREVDAPPQIASATEDAIGALERGGMRAGAAELDVDLRHFKYGDPVRGVINAYIYDSVGDLESIQRMAAYYVQCGQAIPYDIALLAQLGGQRRDDGLLLATVPALQERAPRSDQESRVSWTHTATDEVTGVVGGFWPWLRQGWTFLDDPNEDGSTLVLPGLIEVAEDLTPARFTTLHAAGGRRLSKMFDLARSALEGNR